MQTEEASTNSPVLLLQLSLDLVFAWFGGTGPRCVALADLELQFSPSGFMGMSHHDQPLLICKVWGLLFFIPALERLRQEDCKSVASLDYTVSHLDSKLY